MTRQSKRELEREVADLRDGGTDDGFHHFKIGGDPDDPAPGYYQWDAEREEYVNEHGHVWEGDESTESDFVYTIKYASE